MSWWGKGSDKDKQQAAAPSTPATAQPIEPVESPKDAAKQEFNPDRLPERKKLSRNLQKIVDKSDHDDSFYDELVDGYAPDSTESNWRYAAYANRLRTIMLSAHRYVAYTSDIGESFRPVAHPWLVRSAYGISWTYILGDVGIEGYKAYWQNQRKMNPELQLSEKQLKATGLSNVPEEGALVKAEPGVVAPLEDWRTVMLQRGIFQSVASMGLPAFTIHSVVRYSGRAMKNVKNTRLRTWGPIGLGLAVVPTLPYLFDEPVENAVEWVFHKGFALAGGRHAVGDLPSTGREEQLSKRPKEKEL
ncbi:putative Mitochondrial fission process protein 1 [Seiridium cardinale]|uniref:Mitochondrial fission process protein 1 n=1 Tax=Seiridium cardinale TaxID=138064 RepID=A0ABR2XBZ4_9PEZI